MSKVRVCELLPGDEFEMSGHHYRVDWVGEGEIRYRHMHCNYNGPWGQKYPYGELLSMGGRSQQFVNLLSHEANRHNKKRISDDPEIIGPPKG
jgi:hypothetical protein